MRVVFPEPELVVSESELVVSLKAQEQRVPRNPVTMVMGMGGIAPERYVHANSCRNDRRMLITVPLPLQKSQRPTLVLIRFKLKATGPITCSTIFTPQ